MFSHDFEGNRRKLIHLDSLDVRNKIWRWFLRQSTSGVGEVLPKITPNPKNLLTKICLDNKGPHLTSLRSNMSHIFKKPSTVCNF